MRSVVITAALFFLGNFVAKHVCKIVYNNMRISEVFVCLQKMRKNHGFWNI